MNAGLKAGETVGLVGAGGGLGRKSFLQVTLSQIVFEPRVTRYEPEI